MRAWRRSGVWDISCLDFIILTSECIQGSWQVTQSSLNHQKPGVKSHWCNSLQFYNLSLWVIFRSLEHWEAASCLEDRKSWRTGWVVTQRMLQHFVEGQPLSPQPMLKQSVGKDVFVQLDGPFLLVAQEFICWHSRNQQFQDVAPRGG